MANRFTRFTISMDEELGTVIEQLRIMRGEERSNLLSTLLREHPLIQAGIQHNRANTWAGAPPAIPPLPTLHPSPGVPG